MKAHLKIDRNKFRDTVKAGGEALTELLEKKPAPKDDLMSMLEPYWNVIYDLWHSEHTKKEIIDEYRKATGIDASDFQLRHIFTKIVKKVEADKEKAAVKKSGRIKRKYKNTEADVRSDTDANKSHDAEDHSQVNKSHVDLSIHHDEKPADI